MSIKYQVRFNGEIVGKRTSASNRVYTHAVVVARPAEGTYHYTKGIHDAPGVVAWCGRLDLARKQVQQQAPYWHVVEIVEVEVVPAKAKKAAPSIVVDGVSYKIPSNLLDATDEEITRVIRGVEVMTAKRTPPTSARRFLAAVKALGYTPHNAHELLGIGRSTVFRIVNGTSAVPQVVEKLLGMYLRHGVEKLPEAYIHLDIGLLDKHGRLTKKALSVLHK